MANHGKATRAAREWPVGRAFTIVELLVVISLLFLMVTLVLGVVGKSRRTASVMRIKADLAVISQALEQYRNDFGAYPGTFPQDVPPTPGRLAITLIGPGPATGVGPTGIPADGADGPGFRVVPGGKIWPALLPPEKFRVLGPVESGTGHTELLDYLGHPIMYLPRRRDVDPAAGPLLDANGMYHPGDGPLIPPGALLAALGDRNQNNRIDPGESLRHSRPFILVSGGPDELPGTADDVYNFDP